MVMMIHKLVHLYLLRLLTPRYSLLKGDVRAGQGQAGIEGLGGRGANWMNRHLKGPVGPQHRAGGVAKRKQEQ